jgi:hypothetical protein
VVTLWAKGEGNMVETTDKKAIRLILVEWVTTLGVFLACFLFLLHRMEALETKQDARMQAESQRSDRLYEMFIDLRKDMDQRFRENDQKFYDLLKESKTTNVAVVK